MDTWMPPVPLWQEELGNLVRCMRNYSVGMREYYPHAYTQGQVQSTQLMTYPQLPGVSRLFSVGHHIVPSLHSPLHSAYYSPDVSASQTGQGAGQVAWMSSTTQNLQIFASLLLVITLCHWHWLWCQSQLSYTTSQRRILPQAQE